MAEQRYLAYLKEEEKLAKEVLQKLKDLSSKLKAEEMMIKKALQEEKMRVSSAGQANDSTLVASAVAETQATPCTEGQSGAEEAFNSRSQAPRREVASPKPHGGPNQGMTKIE
ncbi:uncharacterized protein LOC144099451 [Amblyomma americanum]